MKTKNIIKSKKDQQINRREINLINGGAIEGVLQIDVKTKNSDVTLTFTTEGLVDLHEFLKMNEMSKRLFVVLLRNVVVALKSVVSNKLSRDLIIWDLNTLYVDPISWHVYLMYVPLQPFETTGNLKSFILEMISQCNFKPNENIEYAQSLVQDLNSVTVYTIGMLESYCDRVSDELWKQKRKNDRHDICPVCGSKLTAEDVICPFCGKRISSQTHTKSIVEENISYSGFGYSEKDNQIKIEQSNLSHRAILINEDENGVVTVFRGSKKNTHTVWIENCEYAGKISVSRFPFRIGKMEGVTDYRIYSNTVSRKHADILREQGKYFIVDLGSTNGTFLGEKRLQPGVKEELYDGAVFVLADSRFKFHID